MFKSLVVVFAAVATSATSVVALASEPNHALVQTFDEVLAKNNVKRSSLFLPPYVRYGMISEATYEKLLNQYLGFSTLSPERLGAAIARTRLQKLVTCRLADVALIVNGVGETIPVVTFAVRDANGRYSGATSGEYQDIVKPGFISWKSLFGGGLDAIAGVAIETLSSWDLQKVEQAIQKAYPGTQWMAVKLKGDESVCGQATLKLDLLLSLRTQK